MPERAESSVVTKRSNGPVAETVERLKGIIEARSFTLLRVIDHNGTAERVGSTLPAPRCADLSAPAQCTPAHLRS